MIRYNEIRDKATAAQADVKDKETKRRTAEEEASVASKELSRLDHNVSLPLCLCNIPRLRPRLY